MLLATDKVEKDRLSSILKTIPNESVLKKSTEEFKEGDKIYVVKSCKFKRSPLNKFIKSGDIKGLTRTHKIEEATVIIMPRILNTDKYFYEESLHRIHTC